MNKDEFSFLARKLLQRPIAFHRCYVDLGAGAAGALFFSQCVYWSERGKEGWFFKTQEEFTGETGLTRREIDTAKKKLKTIRVLKIVKKGVPCRTFYSVDFSELFKKLSAVTRAQASLYETYKQECTKRTNKNVRNVQTITESTTENTHILNIVQSNDSTTKKTKIVGISIITEEDFCILWGSYPARLGAKGSKSTSRKRIEHIIKKESFSFIELLSIVKKYAAYCDATKKTGTEYVLQVPTFFGKAKEAYKEDYSITNTKIKGARSNGWGESSPMSSGRVFESKVVQSDHEQNRIALEVNEGVLVEKELELF